MSDQVKFIFKTLIKVPIIIAVTYLIFNVFAFTYTYFRLMGFSYVVMQTAVENNYIPYDPGNAYSEGKTLVDYVQNNFNTGVVTDIRIGCDTDVDADPDCNDITHDDGNQNRRVQYGTPIKITVSAKYNFIFPLINPVKNRNQADAMELEYNENPDNNIVISYTVPGLKYYPDLNS